MIGASVASPTTLLLARAFKQIGAYVHDATQEQFLHLNAFLPGSPDPNEISRRGVTIRLLPEPGLPTGIIAGGMMRTAATQAAFKRWTNHDDRPMNPPKNRHASCWMLNAKQSSHV